MEQSAERLGQEPEAVARAFLTALDEGRWSDAADLVDIQTREAFQTWCVEQIGTAARAPGQAGPSDTWFVPAGTLMAVSTAAEAARFTSAELVARFAQAVSPASLHRQMGVRGLSGDVRITRRFLEANPTVRGRLRVQYRTDWWEGDERDLALGGIHSLELVLTGDGWRVRDADLGGWGGGHILPPAG